MAIAYVLYFGYHLYRDFFLEPRKEERQRQVNRWNALINWAKQQEPTKIYVLMGNEQRLLSTCIGEDLCEYVSNNTNELAV